MGLSKELKIKYLGLDEKKQKKLIKMAIEDKISYQEIKKEFGFSPNEVEKIMRSELDERRYRRWRIRAGKRNTLKGRPKDY